MQAHLARLRSFFQRNDGSVAVWFTFALVPLFMGVGVAIDYTRAASLRTKLQSASDGAVLIVMRDSLSKTDSQLKAAAESFVQGAMGSATTTVDMPTFNADRTQANIVIHTSYAPVFLAPAVVNSLKPIGNSNGLAGTSSIQLTAASQATSPTATLEIALVIDNSSSMQIYNAGGGKTRLQATKDGAGTLIDILYGDAATATKTRMSIVPFSHAVRVVAAGSATQSWMDTTGISSIHWENFPDPASTDPNKKPLNPGTASNATTTPNGSWPPASRFDLFRQLNVPWGGCFEHRPGNYGVSDDAPVSGVGDSLFVPMFSPDETGIKDATSWNGDTYLNSYMNDNGGACTTPNPTDAAGLETRLCKYKINQVASLRTASTNVGPNHKCTVQQLTRLKAQPATLSAATTTANALKADINSMSSTSSAPYNMTNLVEGFMWGWRSISPKAPFADGSALDKLDNKKIIIFMTDGKNEWGVTTYEETDNHNKSIYWPFGYYTNNRIPGYTITTINQARTALDARTLQACAAAKASPNNVIVYTIGFEDSTTGIDAQGKQVLSDCASVDPTDGTKKLTYIATSSSELDAVFQNIAHNIGQLRLSQ